MQHHPPSDAAESTRAHPPVTSAEASDFSDTDDESYLNRDSTGSSGGGGMYRTQQQRGSDEGGGVGFEANDVDPDAQIEALDEDIIFGTSTSGLLSENERAVKLTMQLIRESASTAASSERQSEYDTGDESDDPDSQDSRRAQQSQQQQQQVPEEQEIDALLQKKTLRLDWLNIGKIENLDAFTHVQELYLQHNLLRAIENLDNHEHLSFLALGGNRIEKVGGLRHLKNVRSHMNSWQMTELYALILPWLLCVRSAQVPGPVQQLH